MDAKTRYRRCTAGNTPYDKDHCPRCAAQKCLHCGFYPREAEYRRNLREKNGLTLMPNGTERLIIMRGEDI